MPPDLRQNGYAEMVVTLCFENIGKFNIPPNDNVAVTRKS